MEIHFCDDRHVGHVIFFSADQFLNGDLPGLLLGRQLGQDGRTRKP